MRASMKSGSLSTGDLQSDRPGEYPAVRAGKPVAATAPRTGRPGDALTLPEEVRHRLPSNFGLVCGDARGRRFGLIFLGCCTLQNALGFIPGDVIVRRWQSLSGKRATLDGDGRTFEALERRSYPVDD
jgi:hypothetical protein